VYSRRIWLIGGVVAAVAMLSSCPDDKQEMTPTYPKNTPIVVSGGSITATMRNDKDEEWWNCPNDDTAATPGQKVCYVSAIGVPVAVISKGFQNDLSHPVILQSGWSVDAATYPYTAQDGTDHNGHVSIQLASDSSKCGNQNETCIQVTFSDGYDVSDDATDIQHHGRSFRDRSVPNLKVKDFHLASVNISPGDGQPSTTLTCDKNAGDGHHCRLHVRDIAH
jgi:hypothetical protein